MNLRPSRFFLFLALPAMLALPASLPAQTSQATPPAGTFVGLPVTGTLDASKVVAARYGEKPVAAVHRISGGITGVLVDNPGDATQEDLPVSFGQVFAPGDLQPSDRLVGKLGEDARSLPLQIDVKARHPDGSVRHAIVSAILPKLAPRETLVLALARDRDGAPAAGKPATPADLLGRGFQAEVSVRLDGQLWKASAASLLSGKRVQPWLSGALASEWLVSAPLVNARGAGHPHLAARFAVRWYPQAKRARVDVTVENDWAYEPGPRNFTYDAAVSVGGREVYAKPALKHLHHARWRKVFWWGAAEPPAVRLRYDTPYLIASRALPNYDQAIVPSQGALAELQKRWTGAAIEPMGIGLATAYMPTAGGRGDIGLLPDWATLYLLSMDPRAAEATFGTADLAGSWPIHYRDRRTGDPVSLADYPYASIDRHQGETFNPATGKHEAFPACAAEGACETPHHPDLAHQPNFAYLPYLLTGDHYYLEELLFWTSFDTFWSPPNYRENGKGLFRDGQLRGQAWSLRTLGEAAYITPDGLRPKAHLLDLLRHNLDWYNRTYTDNPGANRLHVIVNGYALSYDNASSLAPWQDDFFTAAVGHLAELGFSDAGRLLAWKVRFPIERMTAPGACWIDGAPYNMTVRASPKSPFFGSMAEAYAASHKAEILALPCGSADMAAAFKLRPGEMTGYSSSTLGQPSIMQPALAYAADVAGEPGRKAWERFMARSVKPDYRGAPQFAIVPRSSQGK
jgi:hypothetical protein